MTYVDAAILNVTEALCRQFQRLTGRTNVWLALQLTNLSIVVFFVWAAVYSWGTDLPQQIMIAVFCAGLLYLLTQTVFKESIEAYESNAYRRVAKGLRNPRRIRDALLRISFLTLSIVLWYPLGMAYFALRMPFILLTYVLVVLTTVVLYLLACDPLPPCVGTLRQWVNLRQRFPVQPEHGLGPRSVDP